MSASCSSRTSTPSQPQLKPPDATFSCLSPQWSASCECAIGLKHITGLLYKLLDIKMASNQPHSEDADYVESVMTHATVVNNVDSTPSARKRNRSEDTTSDCDVVDPCKKQRTVPQTKDFTNSDVASILKAEFTSFKNEMKTDLTETLGAKFESFEHKIKDAVLKVVHDEISSVKDDFNKRIDGLSNKLEQKLMKSLESKIDSKINGKVKECSNKLKSDLGIQDIKRDKSNNVVHVNHDLVLRNCEVDPKENNDSNVTLNKVNSIIRDGVKLKDIKVTKCVRKPSRFNKPGVIIATVESAEQKESILANKRKLRPIQKFRNIYIEESRPLDTRIGEANLLTVLNELGKRDKYFISSNGRLINKSNVRNTH